MADFTLTGLTAASGSCITKEAAPAAFSLASGPGIHYRVAAFHDDKANCDATTAEALNAWTVVEDAGGQFSTANLKDTPGCGRQQFDAQAWQGELLLSEYELIMMANTDCHDTPRTALGSGGHGYGYTPVPEPTPATCFVLAAIVAVLFKRWGWI